MYNTAFLFDIGLTLRMLFKWTIKIPAFLCLILSSGSGLAEVKNTFNPSISPTDRIFVDYEQRKQRWQNLGQWNNLAAGSLPELNIGELADHLIPVISNPAIKHRLPGESSVDASEALEGVTDVNLKACLQTALDAGNHQTAESLQVLECPQLQIESLTGIDGFTGLLVLDLSHNLISDISALSSLTALDYINLDGNTLAQIDALSSLTHLAWLKLNANQITNITPLSTLVSITRLELSSNQLSNLTPLEALSNLFYLDVRDNPIQDISVLSDLQNLLALMLGHTLADNISILSNLKQLQILALVNQNITDVSALTELTSLRFLSFLDSSNKCNPNTHAALRSGSLKNTA
ncbi:MAG: Leucine-rich repeat (LRR) protein [Phenylobacterium sp.]|jgi:Leucine-rich repeat (LRR) protein